MGSTMKSTPLKTSRNRCAERFGQSAPGFNGNGTFLIFSQSAATTTMVPCTALRPGQADRRCQPENAHPNPVQPRTRRTRYADRHPDGAA